MAQRLPVVGQDNGTWGIILNGFLEVSHNADGTLQTGALTSAGGELTSNKGQPSGYAGLDGSGKVSIANLPTGTDSTTVAIGNDSRFAGSVAGTSNAALSATDPTTTNSRVPFGAAGGGLQGTYPNPSLTKAGVTATGLAATDVGAVPASVTQVGAPTTGTWATGQSYVDSNGLIWCCSAGGTPGTWFPAGGGGLGELNVMWYGAKGDGTTDDTAAIVQANADAHASGGIVYFPPGQYKTSQTFSVTQVNVAWRGAGSGASILQPTNSKCLDFHLTPWLLTGENSHGGRISGLTLNGANAPGGSVGIEYGGFHNGRFSDLAVHSFTTGIHMNNVQPNESTEGTVWDDVLLFNCTTAINFDVNGGFSSFGYQYLSKVRIYTNEGTGILVSSGAYVYNGYFGVQANMAGGDTLIAVHGALEDNEYYIVAEAAASATGITVDSGCQMTGFGMIDFGGSPINSVPVGTLNVYGIVNMPDFQVQSGLTADAIGLRKGFLTNTYNPGFYTPDNAMLVAGGCSATGGSGTIVLRPQGCTITAGQATLNHDGSFTLASGVTLKGDSWHTVGSDGGATTYTSGVSGAVSYRLSLDDQYVELKGNFVGCASGSVAFTLPTGYITSAQRYILCADNDGYATLSVDTLGNVIPYQLAGSVSAGVFLDGLRIPL